MKISQASQLTGLSIDTLRYYESIGLIKPSISQSQRDYSQEDIDNLIAIKTLKTAQFTLEEIRMFTEMDEKYPTMESIYNMDQGDYHRLTQLIIRKKDEIENVRQSLDIADQLLNSMSKKLKEIEK